MLVLKTEQNKEWDQIQKILTDNNIEFLETRESAIMDYEELERIGYQLVEMAVKRKNEEQRKDITSVLGALLSNLGENREKMLISVTKGDPLYFEGDCTTAISVEEEVVKVLEKEGETSDWLEDFMQMNCYSYDVEFMDLDEEEKYEVETPRKVAEYGFL